MAAELDPRDPRGSSPAPAPRAVVAALAHRRLKRAQGLLRAAVKAIAPDAADVDVLGEARLEDAGDVQELVELVELLRHRYGVVDVVLLSTPTQEP